MRAVLLAAGLGTRLRPLTDTIPKCLVPIKGKPLLDIWCETLLAAGVEKVLVNTHYKHQVVEEHLVEQSLEQGFDLSPNHLYCESGSKYPVRQV